MTELQQLLSGFEQSLHLARYCSRLFGELVHLHGDSIRFTAADGGENGLRAVICRGESSLKSSTMAASWQEAILGWLQAREAGWLSRNIAASRGDAPLRAGSDFMSAVRLQQGIVLCRVGRGEKGFVLTDFRSVELEDAQRFLGLSEYSRLVLAEAGRGGSRMLAAAAPSPEEIARTVASVLSLTEYHYLSSAQSPHLSAALEKIRPDVVPVVSVVAADAAQAAVKLAPVCRLRGAIRLSGVFCQVFVPRVCSGCAAPDAQAGERLKAFAGRLENASEGRFLTGSGCPRCGRSGFAGEIGVQSALYIDSRLEGRLAAEAPEDEIMRQAAAAGSPWQACRITSAGVPARMSSG